MNCETALKVAESVRPQCSTIRHVETTHLVTIAECTA